MAYGKKTKQTELPYDPAIPLLGIYLEKMETNFKRYMQAALFTIAKTWKQPRCHQQTTGLKRCGVHIYKYTHTNTHTVEYYSAIKKE